MAHQVLALIQPGVIARIMAGEVEGLKIGSGLILLFAVLFLVPLIMAFLSLTLKDSMNRWANITVGAVFAILWCVDLIEVAETTSAGVTLMILLTVVAPALIVWYAWRSKQKA